MNTIKSMLTIAVLSLGTGCMEEKKITVDIPMSDIYLSAPASNTIIDLNDETKQTYEFSWKENEAAGNTIIFSSTSLLDPQVTFDAGKATSITLTPEDMDKCFSSLGIKSGSTATVYWTVKATERQTTAASDIKIVAATRMKTVLLLPEDQLTLSLDAERADAQLAFQWDRSSLPDGEEVSVVFSLGADLVNPVKLDAGSGAGTSFSYAKLEEVLTTLGVRPFSTGTVYWNIQSASGKMLSRTSLSMNLERMMQFTDVRGTESITYKVTRIRFSDGTSQIWLAENLRATKYPDGKAIESDNILLASSSLDPAMQKAYGAYYRDNIKKKVAPNGWRLPTMAEFEFLFFEATRVEGSWNVLKDGNYWPNLVDKTNLNAWKLGLVTSGQTQDMKSVSNTNSTYCYLLVDDVEEYKCVLHDGGGTLWWPWSTGTPGRFIYIEQK